MSMPPKIWTLLGDGALGSVLAGLLQQSGLTVSLLRTRPSSRDQPDSLTWLDRTQQPHTFTPQRWGVEQAAQIECLLVTTKAYAVQPALEPLIGRLPITTPILLLHNGMGTAGWVERAFPGHPLLLGITSNAALRDAAGRLHHTGAGETWIGAGNAAARPWQAIVPLLAHALPHAAWSDDIASRQWEKLVINALINPLTALQNVRNGALLDQAAELEPLCNELLPLLAHQGLHHEAEHWLHRVWQVLRATAENYSSMQQDLAAGRPTEIDYITGYLLRTAQEAGMTLPRHQQLYDAIKHKELL